MTETQAMPDTPMTAAPAAKTIDPQEAGRLVAYIAKCKTQGESAASEYRERADEMWELFQNKQDYTKKERWQSRAFIPKVQPNTLRSASMLERAVLQTSKLFTLSAAPDLDIPTDTVGKAETRAKQLLDDSNFAAAFGQAMISGFLVGAEYVKALWEGDKVVFYPVDSLNVSIDPKWSPVLPFPPRYIVEHKELPLYELMATAIQANEMAKMGGVEPVYDMAELDKLASSTRNLAREADERERRGEGNYQDVSPYVSLDEFWGEAPSEDGKTVEKNLLMQSAGGHLIRKQKNPFAHGLPPFVPVMPIPYPHRGIGGISLVEGTAKTQKIFNNILNMNIDALNFSVNPMWEANESVLVRDTPASVTRTWPGKLIWKKADSSALTQIRFQNAGLGESLQLMNTLDRADQAATGVTEFIEGMSGSVQKTATEVDAKSQATKSFFDVIARRVELMTVKPLIEMFMSLHCQFGQNDLIAFRPDTNKLPYTVTVGGISIALSEQQQIGAVVEILGMVMKDPTGTALKMTDVEMLWQELLSLRNLSKAYVGPEERQKRAQEAQGAQVQAGAQPGAQPQPSLEELAAIAGQMLDQERGVAQ